MAISDKFFIGVLGRDGAKALRRAVTREPSLESVVLPRTVLGWLSGKTSFEGEIPGVPNSYVNLHKSETGVVGLVAIDDQVVKFDGDEFMAAAAVAVALGTTHQVEMGLKPTTLQALGKSIDCLIKAQEELKVKPIDLTKAISAIPKGTPTTDYLGDAAHDYSHVLSPEHRRAGYKVLVSESNPSSPSVLSKDPQWTAQVIAPGGKDPVGMVEAWHNPKAGVLHPEVADITDEHKGKGLGQAMYEALFAHGFHHQVHTIAGDHHSSEASRVHAKLAQKHGLDYKPTANPSQMAQTREPGPYDAKFGPYKYTLKQEVSMGKTDLPGRTAQPIKQVGPQGPIPPTARQPQLPRRSLKAPSLKIDKSEATKPCPYCSGLQFKGHKFVGCLCFADLAKSIITTVYGDGYALDFEQNFDKEAFLVLNKYFRS